MTDSQYNNWHLERDDNHIITAVINVVGSTENVLNQEVFVELEAILTRLKEEQDICGLIIQSGKKSGFILGADVKQFSQIESEDQALTYIEKGQYIFSLLSQLPFPTVAKIKGNCLGGGCELALACRYRVMEDSDTGRIGLPEVKLGIHPGWGGTVRLEQVVGVTTALDIMLAGKVLRANQAVKIGLIDEVVPARHFDQAAIDFILKRPKQKRGTKFDFLFKFGFFRNLFAKYIHKKLRQKISPQHYPAPFQLLENWRQNFNPKKAYQVEAKSVAKLIQTETATNLTRLFLLQEKVKREAKNFNHDIQHVHVIGAGTMGGDIAAWCALQGLEVTLQDQSLEHIAKAVKRAYRLFKSRLKSPRKIEVAMDRLQVDIKGDGLHQADVVIEAIFEDMAAKQALFCDIEKKVADHVVLATNTSSISLDEIASSFERPERLVGIHFFNPVAKMPLIEVIYGAKTDPRCIEMATVLAHKLNKTPIQVKNQPGFLVNRILTPYLMEAFLLYQEGNNPALIDRAATEFGMPMGPIELADQIGLDICLSVCEFMSYTMAITVPDELRDRVKRGLLGRKSKRGFYRYQKDKPVKDKDIEKPNNFITMQNRLIYSMLNESMAVLREGIVSTQDDLDLGMVFGTGFAPFRGGPMRYIASIGKDSALEHLQALHQECGERFKPDSNWFSP